MDIKQEIFDAPRALKETLEKGRADYEALVRRTRWGEGPVFIIGSGPFFYNALSGVCAFESLVGWPVIAHRAEEFKSYPISALRPRSVLIILGQTGESEETLEAARAAKANGTVVLALTSNPESPLALLADEVFLLRVGDEAGSGLQLALCQRAALGLIGLLAARVFRRHQPYFDVLEEDFHNLPDRMEWVLTQLTDAARSLAGELKSCSAVNVTGGGFYYSASLQAAHSLIEFGGINAYGVDPFGFLPASSPRQLDPLLKNSSLLVLSGSRCREKGGVHELANRWERSDRRVFSVTDSNDRELIGASTLAVILPVLTDTVGSTLSLVVILGLACQSFRTEAGRAESSAAKPLEQRSGRSPKP